MIKFFRNIRRRFLTDHKFSNYFLYTIGEILLVVIGILIALQINNWNEAQIQKTEETKILAALLTDLKKAVIESEQYYREDSIEVKKLEIFLFEKNGIEQLSENGSIDSLINEIIFGVQTNVPMVQVYEDLKSSGSSTVITDQLIRNKLAELDHRYETLEFQIGDKMTVQQNRVDQVVIDHLNFKITALGLSGYNSEGEWSPDYEILRTSKKIVNILSMKLRISQYVFQSRKSLQHTLEELIILIESTLSAS